LSYAGKGDGLWVMGIRVVKSGREEGNSGSDGGSEERAQNCKDKLTNRYYTTASHPPPAFWRPARGEKKKGREHDGRGIRGRLI